LSSPLGFLATKGEARFNPNCDIDGNGEINIYDVVIATSRYGHKETNTPKTKTIPSIYKKLGRKPMN
jgi:hypothetical protein